jgi:soluble lytic murein transglycosylase
MKWLWPTVYVCLALLGGGAWWEYYQWRDHSQDAVILAAAKRYGVEPALVKAIVWRESRFNPRAQGNHGERGLMQIREIAAWEWARGEHLTGFVPDDLFDPSTNTLAGAAYLARVLRRYAHTDNPILYAVADYNAGRGNVLRWNNGAGSTNSVVFLAQMDFPGTKKYVETVLRRFEHYRPIFPKPASN